MKRAVVLMCLFCLICFSVPTWADGENNEMFAVEESDLQLFADVEEYPAGGLQFQEKYDTETAMQGFGIGSALKWMSASGRVSKDITPKNLEGIIVHKGNSAKDGTEFDYAVEGPNASLIFEYDIYFEDLVQGQSELNVRIWDVVNHTDTYPIAVSFHGGSGKVSFNGQESATFTEPLQDHKWYRVRHEIFSTDENLNPLKQHSMWINGTPVFEKIAFVSVNSQKFPNIQMLGMQKEENSSGTGCTIYVDNVLAFKKNVNMPQSPLEEGGILNAIRTAEQRLEGADVGTGEQQYAEDVYQELCSCLDDAKESYRASDRTEDTLRQSAETLWQAIQAFQVNGPALLIAEPGVYRSATSSNELSSLATASKPVVKTTLSASRFANPEGENAVIVVLVCASREGFGEEVRAIATSGGIKVQPGETVESVVPLDLSSFADKRELYLKIMAWNSFSKPAPYWIPSIEKFKSAEVTANE